MTSHQVTYQGPPSFAVQAAALIADTDGVELTSAAPPEHAGDPDESVLLAITLEGTAEAVTAALESVRADLPPGATVTLDEPGVMPT